MYIGYMGDIVFLASSHYFLTPSNTERSTAGRWQDHELIYKKPVSEFLGADLQEMSFDLFLSKQYGIDPKKQYEELKTMCETGAVFPLILGGRPVSQNYWTLRSLSLSDVYYTPTGKMHTAKVSVKLKEYDDSNYTEEKTKVDLYGLIGNAITGIF